MDFLYISISVNLLLINFRCSFIHQDKIDLLKMSDWYPEHDYTYSKSMATNYCLLSDLISSALFGILVAFRVFLTRCSAEVLPWCLSTNSSSIVLSPGLATRGVDKLNPAHSSPPLFSFHFLIILSVGWVAGLVGFLNQLFCRYESSFT